MPRGSNPNSRQNLEKGKPFNTDTARIAAQKSAQTRMYMSDARNALKDALTDDELRKQVEQLLARGRKGNLTAIKMIFDYSETKQNEQDSGAEVNLAFLAPTLPEEEPPEGDPDE